MEEQKYTIILRHDTSTMWLVNDPILALGEYGVEDDTHKVKRGNGESKWSELTYEDFGLQYIVTYANLSGEISDNEALTEMFNKKLSVEIFDDVNGSVLSNLKVNTTDVDGIAQINKTYKNIKTGTTNVNSMLIKSEDNTVQGYWSIDKAGNRILNVIAVCSITDYQPSHRYYKDQLCYFNNKLYRAYRDIDADKSFNEGQWVLLASLHASDIKYDNLVSGMDATDVKGALDELKRRDDRKLPKSTEPNSVYGTTDLGEQVMIPVDDLRKVDTVNRKKADLNKNIQLDAGEINYNDANPELGSVRKVLDDKVDKNFAGEGAKIVRNVEFNYNDEAGTIELVLDKVSPANSESDKVIKSIDVVSEKELAKNVEQINTRIDTEIETLNNTINEKETTINNRIDNEVSTLNQTITDTKTKLNTRIDTEVETLNNTINETKSELDTKLDDLTNVVNTNKQEINDKVDNIKTETDKTIADNKTDIEQKLDEAKTKLKQNIDINDGEINGRVTNEVKTLNERIDTEVETLNNTITEKETALNETITEKDNATNTRISNEVDTLNTTINDKIATVNETIANNKTDIEKKLNDGLDTKIDKDIADNILTDISASQQGQEPTLKLVRKNTRSKEAVINHIHFTAVGNIKTTFSNEDHILIDSTEIDNAINEHTRRLDNVDGRLTAHDKNIAALEEHDVNHDNLLATHSEQIANHETRMANLETRADGFDTSIADLDSNIENEITNRKVADAKLETDISRNAVNIENNAAAIRDNADNITNLNDLLQQNVSNLTKKKVDKTFAEASNNMVVGNIDYSAPNDTELLKINKTLVSPVDGSHSVTGFKIHSSDNTVVATPIMKNDELVGIDIATNLDTDVNYFVTSEILNTTIPSDNTISLDSLTATDKATVELQDIISDSEGTWARVKSIDTEANTCIAVTFHKHAQAVWGTVKGDINSQADLIAKLAEKFSIPGSGAMQSYVGGDTIDYTLTGLTTEIDNEEYMSELSVESIAYNFKDGTGNGHRLMYLKQREENINDCDIMFRKATDDNGNKYIVPRVCAENIYFNPQNSGLSSNKLSAAIRELRTLAVADNESTKNALQNTETQLNNTINEKEIALNKAITDLNADLLNQIQIVRDEKLSQVNGVTNSIYGINENGQQVTFSTSIFGNVDSVNGIVAKNKDIVITGKDIDMSSDDDKKLTDVITLLNDTLATIKTELQNQFIVYKPDTIFKLGTVVTNMFTTFVRDDGIMLMAKVLKSFTADNTHETNYECFAYDIEQGNLKLVGIPEQIGEGGDEPTPPASGDVVDSELSLANNMKAVVSHSSDNTTKYIDYVNNSGKTMVVLDPTHTWTLPNNIVDSGKTITATTTDSSVTANNINATYIDETFNITDIDNYGQKVMSVLNDVDGNTDTFTELGATEQEISTKLDNIAGNN